MPSPRIVPLAPPTLAAASSVSSVSVASIELLVGLLVLALGTALVAQRLRFPYTLALVLVGLLLGFLRALPEVRLDPNTVLFIFLPALLFEGAWSTDVALLAKDWLAIALLAVPGLFISVGLVALTLHVGAALPWLLALLLGAIVSPTDPVAVLALLRQLGMPARLRAIVDGESLFNDGVGAAVYIVVLSLLLGALGVRGEFTGQSLVGEILRVCWLFVGGPLLGVGIGLAAAQVLRTVDDRLVEATLTFSVAYSVYLVGDRLHTSGLLAVVCAGLLLGSYGRRVGMRPATREAVDTVWEFIGFVANSLLFLLLGLEIGAASFVGALAPIAWAVLGVVVGRAVMVYALIGAQDLLARILARRLSPATSHTRIPRPLPAAWRPLIVLSGLRGALSVALALSLPVEIPTLGLAQRIVYGVVLFTLLGQGLGMRLLLPRWPHVRGEGHVT